LSLLSIAISNPTYSKYSTHLSSIFCKSVNEFECKTILSAYTPLDIRFC
jgi:hypothetical protein